MRILVTGFEPFGRDNLNASEQAVEQLAPHIEVDDIDVEVFTRILPVSFERGPRILAHTIAELKPDAVIAVGEAGKRHDISVELFARNVAHARIPDNDGYQACQENLDEVAAVLQSRLPCQEIIAELNVNGISASESVDAGAYVCNAVFRSLLRTFSGPAGFIHVPAVRDSGVARVGAETDSDMGEGLQFSQADLSIADLATALTLVCQVVARNIV